MKMKMKDEDEFPTFCAGCEIGKIEINPNAPSVKITPNQGRRVYLTGSAARLVVDFITMILLSDDYSTEKLKEPTDGLRYFS